MRSAPVLLAVAAAALAIAVGDAAATPKTQRVGTVAPVPAGVRATGTLSGATRLKLTVALAPSDPSGLADYANEVSEPGSALYRHYLTVSEFASRFGASAATQQAVESDLRAKGLSVGSVSRNGLSLPVSGTATAVSAAFSVGFDQYSVPAGGGTPARTAYGATSAPALDTSIADDVQSVIGLSTVAAAMPEGLSPAGMQRSGPVSSQVSSRASSGVDSSRADISPQANTSSGPVPCQIAKTEVDPSQKEYWTDYTYDELAGAYGLDPLYSAGDQGSGVTIAIYELANNVENSDISAFDECYSISPTIDYTPVDGGATSGAVESELDIETIAALAPGATIDVYQGPNAGSGDYDTYAAIIGADSAQVISTSWGLCEASEGRSDAEALDTLFKEAAVQGQSVLAASGDSGSEACSGSNALGVQAPASDPYVTSVGGTTLSAYTPTRDETVWNVGGGATGGGISKFFTMPGYQQNAGAGLGVINADSSAAPCGAPSGDDCREVPDVSADADPNAGYLIYNDGNGDPSYVDPNDAKGWIGEGGTSAAAPLWAAFLALVDASSACDGTPIGLANPSLYAAASSSAYGGDFNDITSGNNDLGDHNGGLYPAQTGYDMATGLGTPIGAALAGALCAQQITVANPGTQSEAVGLPVSLQVSASGGGGSSLTYSATSLPSGLSISSSGLISGTPTAPGNMTVTVTASTSGGVTGSTSFTANVVTSSVNLTNPASQDSTEGTVITPLQISASDTVSAESLSYSALDLPTGLSLSASGLISGTPTAAGSASVTVKVTDTSGKSDSATFNWDVAPPVTVTNPGTQSDTVGLPVSLQIDGSGGQGSLRYSATGLPDGLSISSSGLISGTPAATATGSATVTVTATATQSFGATTFTINVGTSMVSVTNPGTQGSTALTAITPVQITASDTVSAEALSYSSSDLPMGLRISSSTGVISGTPQDAGTTSVTVTVTDTSGQTGMATFNWDVAPPITVTDPGTQNDTVGLPVSLQISGSGGQGALTYAATGLPDGLSISPNGLISGTPTGAEGRTVTVTASASGSSGSTQFTINVGTSSVSVTNPGTQSSTVGTPIKPLQISATDSAAGESFTYAASGLPAGLSLSPSGVVSGTPTAESVNTVTFKATDTSGSSSQTNFSWNVTSPSSSSTTTTGTGTTTTSGGSGAPGTGGAPTAPASASISANGQVAYEQSVTAPAGTTIEKVVITLPSTLTLTGSKMQLAKGIKVTATGGRVLKLTTAKHKLTISVRGADAVNVKVAKTLLRAARSVVKTVKAHHQPKLTFTVVVTGSAGAPETFSVTVT